MPQPEKVSKREARYHPASHYCGACFFYETLEYHDKGMCEKVKGVVEYDGGCELFKPIR